MYLRLAQMLLFGFLPRQPAFPKSLKIGFSAHRFRPNIVTVGFDHTNQIRGSNASVVAAVQGFVKTLTAQLSDFGNFHDVRSLTWYESIIVYLAFIVKFFLNRVQHCGSIGVFGHFIQLTFDSVEDSFVVGHSDARRNAQT